MPLTSQIKKLEGFLQKLIKFEPGIIPGRKMRQKRLIGVDGDADALGPGVFGVGLGATTETIRKRNVLTRTGNEKRKPFKLC
jgi:hypothetical protein